MISTDLINSQLKLSDLIDSELLTNDQIFSGHTFKYLATKSKHSHKTSH